MFPFHIGATGGGGGGGGGGTGFATGTLSFKLSLSKDLPTSSNSGADFVCN